MSKLLKNYLLNILFISLLPLSISAAQIIFTPFEDQSDFKGKWSLSTEVPNYLAAYFREFHQLEVLSASAYNSLLADETSRQNKPQDLENITAVNKNFNMNYALMGKIISFEVSRFIAGDLTLAGYEAYSCKIEIKISIYNLRSQQVSYSNTILSEVNNRGLGLTLLGKPTEAKQQFYSLDNLIFGGEEFSKTIVGETMLEFCKKLSADIKLVDKYILQSNPHKNTQLEKLDNSLDKISIKTEIVRGKLLTYDPNTGEAFINLGSSADISAGDLMFIYAKSDSLFDPASNQFIGFADKRVSELEIVEVRGEKLSLAVVRDNLDAVITGMEVRKFVLKQK